MAGLVSRIKINLGFWVDTSKNKNIDHGVGETCAITSTQITCEIDHISLLQDSTISSALNFCFLCILSWSKRNVCVGNQYYYYYYYLGFSKISWSGLYDKKLSCLCLIVFLKYSWKKKKAGTNSCVRSEAALGQKNNTSIPALVIIEKISYLG